MFNDRANRLQLPYEPSIAFTLAPGQKVLEARVIIAGQLVVSGGTTSGTIIGEGGPINLIKRIQLYANRAASNTRYPGSYLVDCSARALMRYAIIERQGKFMGDLLGNTLGSGAAGTYTIYTSIPIYFADSTLYQEFSTALNMDLVDSTSVPIYSQVQVKVDLATDLTTCFSGNDRVLNTSGLTFQWWDDRLQMPQDTVPILQADHDLQIAAAQTRMLDPAMPTDGLFTSWLIMAEQNTTSKTLSQALLNRVTARGSSFNFDEYANDIQQVMIDEGFYDPSQSLTGQYFIDWTKGGLLNSNPAAGILLQLDVNNPSGSNLDQLRIYTRRLMPLTS